MNLNREVLSKIFVSKGDMYANDALQSICSRIFKYDNDLFLNFQGQCFEDKTLYESEEYKGFSKGLTNMINLFNSIVELGKDSALQFIEANWEQFIGYPFKK